LLVAAGADDGETVEVDVVGVVVAATAFLAARAFFAVLETAVVVRVGVAVEAVAFPCKPIATAMTAAAAAETAATAPVTRLTRRLPTARALVFLSMSMSTRHQGVLPEPLVSAVNAL
jgi:hypothetical protein